MSSVFLTSTDMTMIESLLDEVRQKGADPADDMVKERTRFLVEAFQSGVLEEEALRTLLARHVASIGPQVESAKQKSERQSKADLEDWDNEGGAAQAAGHRKNKNVRYLF